MSDKIVVAYWKIRGLGAPLRMMCEFANQEYEAISYDVTGEAGNWDLSSWFGVKPALVEKNPLMNLPYVIVGDTVVTQSNACFTFLGRKLNLNGKDDAELTKNEQCLCQIMDMRNSFVELVYSPKEKFDEKVESYVKGVATHYKKLEGWLQKQGTQYCAADEPTTCDFHLWEMLDQHELLAQSLSKPSFLASYPTLQGLYSRFKALPTLQKYFDGPQHQFPCNNKMASFGAGPTAAAAPAVELEGNVLEVECTAANVKKIDPDAYGVKNRDPWCKIVLGDQEWKSSVKKNCLDPLWEEKTKFVVTDAETQKLEVSFFLGDVQIGVTGTYNLDNLKREVGTYKGLAVPGGKVDISLRPLNFGIEEKEEDDGDDWMAFV